MVTWRYARSADVAEPWRTRVLCSSSRTGEGQMRDAAGRGRGLDPIVLLEALEPVPEANALDRAGSERPRRACGRRGRRRGTRGSSWALRRCARPGRPPPRGRSSSASPGEASRKWNVVPPSISIDGRGRWVRTKVGVWNGGLGPHQPFQSGSSCHPGGPNLFAPMISAPIPGANRCANASSTPLLPPGLPTISLQNRVANIHSCNRWPAWPNGASSAQALAGAEAVERDGEVVDADE